MKGVSLRSKGVGIGLLWLLCTLGLSAPLQAEEGVDARLGKIEKRLIELETIMAGPMAHLIGENRQQHGSLDARIEQLEQALSELRAELAAGRSTPAPAASPQPQPSAATPTLSAPVGSAPEVRVVLPGERRAEQTQPASASSGNFAVVLLSSPNADATDRELLRLRDMGIEAEKRSIDKSGQTMYRIVVVGFISREQAESYASTVHQKAALENKPWVYSE